MPVKKHLFSWERISKFFSLTSVWIGEGILIGIALIFGFMILRSFLLNQPRKQITISSNSETTSSVVQTSPVTISSFVDNVFNGSFTELFSGTGWSDVQETTAYLDFTATTISLIPEFTVTSVIENQGISEQIPKIPKTIMGTVVKKDGVYVISALGNTVTSPYLGVLRFGYDSKTGNTLVVYSAYRSRVFQVSARGDVVDYSERFGQRAFGGVSNGELAVYPTIFSKDGVWWIASGDGSTKPFLAKISGSSVTDYASLAFPNEDTLRALPGLEPHSILVIGNKKTYILQDGGFSQKNVEWVSTRLNDWDGVISKAVISRSENSEGYKITESSGGNVNYFLSNNGGSTWIPTAVGKPVDFSSSGGSTSLTTGGDFRFKVELSPATNNKYVTPWVGTIALEYKISRK